MKLFVFTLTENKLKFKTSADDRLVRCTEVVWLGSDFIFCGCNCIV